MDLSEILQAADAARAAGTLRRLFRHHSVPQWVLTGGFAVEMQMAARGGRARERALHDIDFLVDHFSEVPESLSREFLLRHVHPADPPGKTLLQAVDAEARLRVDVFRAYGSEMERALPGILDGFPVRVVSLADLTARHARLCWELVEGKQVAPKYARDLLRMLEVAEETEVEAVWPEHRRPESPPLFAEAVRQIRRTVECRPELLAPPTYSQEVQAVCPRCESTTGLPLADAAAVLAVLGYC